MHELNMTYREFDRVIADGLTLILLYILIDRMPFLKKQVFVTMRIFHGRRIYFRHNSNMS